MKSISPALGRFVRAALSWSFVLGGAATSVGCGGGDGAALTDGVTSSPETATSALVMATPPSSTTCDRAEEGCACDEEGLEVSCPGPTTRSGSFVSCQAGLRRCDEGVWGPCLTAHLYTTNAPLTLDYASSCAAPARAAWRTLTLEGTPASATSNMQVGISVQTADTEALLDDAPQATASASADGHFATTDVAAVLATAGQSPRSWLRVTLTVPTGTWAHPAPVITAWQQATECDGS